MQETNLWDKTTGDETRRSCPVISLYSTNYLVLLSDAVSTGLSLYVILWVPVTVKDDDSVGCCKVYTQTTSTSRQQETEILQTDTLHWI